MIFVTFAGRACEAATDQTMWLVDRPTGNVYCCQAEGRGRASCEPDVATASVGDRANGRAKAPKDGRQRRPALHCNKKIVFSAKRSRQRIRNCECRHDAGFALLEETSR
ncbi:hypothetical protein [Bradyrhizobium guangzhouense]|uniref:Uncharacterized protein n=1 Tax=Bradyrhizobium guangzhouense TaxID=1325095 RepID=A0AAE5X4Q1_9BRAD|nr:hypothetical protein [Bradyrhizobium guangzhouense]QAU48643.1 hypothetical protein XH91_27000 [Bradyrhizobium guangzhouense]RXH09605.1 hypothetical protein EAS56_25195 [Bradyrhizobium guangzhouense]